MLLTYIAFIYASYANRKSDKYGQISLSLNELRLRHVERACGTWMSVRGFTCLVWLVECTGAPVTGPPFSLSLPARQPMARHCARDVQSAIGRACDDADRSPFASMT